MKIGEHKCSVGQLAAHELLLQAVRELGNNHICPVGNRTAVDRDAKILVRGATDVVSLSIGRHGGSILRTHKQFLLLAQIAETGVCQGVRLALCFYARISALVRSKSVLCNA